MADNTKLQYIVELLTQGDTAKATAELTKLNKASGEAGKGLETLTNNAKVLFGVLGGTALLTQSIEQFIQQEKAVSKLNAALKSTGQFTPEVSKELQDLANSFQEVTNVADDSVLNVMAKLVALGARKQDVAGLTEKVLDLATLLDKDLNRATLAVGKALQGEFSMFKELGFQVDDTRGKMETMNEVFDQMATKAGGQARAAAESLGGQMESLKRIMEDTEKTLGRWIALSLNAAGNAGADVLEMMNVKNNQEAAAAAERIRQSNLDLADILRRQVLEKSKIGELDEEETKRLLVRLTAAQELLRYLQPNATAMSSPVMRESFSNLFAQFQTSVAPVRKALGAPGAAGNTPQAEPQKKVISLDLARKDLETWYQAFFGLNDEAIKGVLKLADIRQKDELDAIKLEDQQIEDFKRGEQLKQGFVNEMLLASLDGAEREKAQLEINHKQRLDQIAETRFATSDQYDEAIAKENELHDAQVAGFERANSLAAKLNVNVTDLAAQGIQLFAGGLAGAIVGAFEEGDKALQKFAQRFLKAVAEMILQTLILKAIQAGLRALGGGGQAAGPVGDFNSNPNIAATAAFGGMFAGAIRAAGGVSDVSSPMFFPRFNVLAGEAGREVMTVLAQPRMVNFNGLAAQVGMAGSNRLAITSADALAARAGGGAGGAIDIRVTMSPDVKAEVMGNSIKGARLMVIHELNQDGAISRGVKALTA